MTSEKTTAYMEKQIKPLESSYSSKTYLKQWMNCVDIKEREMFANAHPQPPAWAGSYLRFLHDGGDGSGGGDHHRHCISTQQLSGNYDRSLCTHTFPPIFRL